MIKSVICCGILFFWSILVHAQTPKIKELKAQLAAATSDSVKISTLNKLCRVYNSHNPDSLPYFADQMALYNDPKKYPLVRKNIASSYGIYHFRRGNYDSSIYYFEKNRDYSLEDGDSLGTAHSLSNAGAVYSSIGENEKALKYFLNALKIKRALGPKHEETLITTMTNICGTYQNLELIEEALFYAKEAGKIATKFDNKLKMSTAYENTGSLLMDLESWDSAEYYLRRALVINREHENAFDIAVVKRKLGAVLIELGRAKKGIALIRESVAYLEGTNYKLEKTRGYDAIAGYNIENHDFTKALIIYRKSYAIYQEMGSQREVALTLYNIAKTLKKLGRHAEAYETLYEHKQLQDSIFSFQTAQAISETEVKYKTEKKEQALALQAEKLSRQEAEINQQQLVRNVSIGGAVLLGVVAFLIYSIKSRSNDEISSKNVQLTKALSEREALLKEIHHRVKNNLQIIASLLYLQSDETESQTVKELLEQGQGRVRSMALIHQKLYENEDLKSIPFQEYLNELIGEIQKSFGSKAQHVQLDVRAEDVYFDVETAVPLGLIINELSTNAFKYAFSTQLGGMLKVHINKTESNYEMVVADNGVGIPDDKLNDPNSKSLGLKLTKMLSEQIEGEYEFNNTSGTSFELKFSA